MPLTRLEVEQLAPDRWTAELEVGGMSAVRRHLPAHSWDEMMATVNAAHAEMMPKPPAPHAEAPPKPAEAPKPPEHHPHHTAATQHQAATAAPHRPRR